MNPPRTVESNIFLITSWGSSSSGGFLMAIIVGGGTAIAYYHRPDRSSTGPLPTEEGVCFNLQYNIVRDTLKISAAVVTVLP